MRARPPQRATECHLRRAATGAMNETGANHNRDQPKADHRRRRIESHRTGGGPSFGSTRRLGQSIKLRFHSEARECVSEPPTTTTSWSAVCLMTHSECALSLGPRARASSLARERRSGAQTGQRLEGFCLGPGRAIGPQTMRCDGQICVDSQH